MYYNVPRYFKQKNIESSNIMSLTRETPHTIITLFDGEQIMTTIPMKEIVSYLPEGEFLNISKGITLRKDQIVHISDEGVYTLTNGNTFQGRKRNISQHRQIRKELGLSDVVSETPAQTLPLNLLEKCSLLDDMPLAFCVIELVFDTDGHGVDFIFRYCNQEMAVVEGVPVEDMIDRSFYEVFENGDRKWLVTYADVALNGTKHMLHDYSPEIDQTLTIHCYQPCPGYCACVLIPS